MWLQIHHRKAIRFETCFFIWFVTKSILLNYSTSKMHLAILFFDIMNCILIFWVNLALKCIFGVWPDVWSLWCAQFCCIGSLLWAQIYFMVLNLKSCVYVCVCVYILNLIKKLYIAVHVCVTPVSSDTRRGCQNLWNWRYTAAMWLWATMWTLGLELGSPRRTSQCS